MLMEKNHLFVLNLYLLKKNWCNLERNFNKEKGCDNPLASTQGWSAKEHGVLHQRLKGFDRYWVVLDHWKFVHPNQVKLYTTSYLMNSITIVQPTLFTSIKILGNFIGE